MKDKIEEAAKQVREEITGMWNQTCGVSRHDYELGAKEALDRLEEILPKFEQSPLIGIEELKDSILKKFEETEFQCHTESGSHISYDQVWDFIETQVFPHLRTSNTQSEAGKYFEFIEWAGDDLGEWTFMKHMNMWYNYNTNENKSTEQLYTEFQNSKGIKQD